MSHLGLQCEKLHQGLLGNFLHVIAQSVVWENPNPIHQNCVTQLGTTITVTSIDVPLILVKDKSNTREASRVTLGGLRWKVKSDGECPYRSRSKSGKRLERK
jgi:hypothetical protein